MNVDQYFKDRSELVARVLRERPFVRDWRVYSVGAVCLVGAMALQVWATYATVDPGFFARISTFLIALVVAGFGLLAWAFTADVFIARVAIPSRDAVVGQTLGQMVKIDGSIAHRLIGASKASEQPPR